MAEIQLMGVGEVAVALGLSKPSVDRIRKDPTRGFPEPLAVLMCGPIFDAAKVQRWINGPDGMNDAENTDKVTN